LSAIHALDCSMKQSDGLKWSCTSWKCCIKTEILAIYTDRNKHVFLNDHFQLVYSFIRSHQLSSHSWLNVSLPYVMRMTDINSRELDLVPCSSLHFCSTQLDKEVKLQHWRGNATSKITGWWRWESAISPTPTLTRMLGPTSKKLNIFLEGFFFTMRSF